MCYVRFLSANVFAVLAIIILPSLTVCVRLGSNVSRVSSPTSVLLEVVSTHSASSTTMTTTTNSLLSSGASLVHKLSDTAGSVWRKHPQIVVGASVILLGFAAMLLVTSRVRTNKLKTELAWGQDEEFSSVSTDEQMEGAFQEGNYIHEHHSSDSRFRSDAITLGNSGIRITRRFRSVPTSSVREQPEQKQLKFEDFEKVLKNAIQRTHGDYNQEFWQATNAIAEKINPWRVRTIPSTDLQHPVLEQLPPRSFGGPGPLENENMVTAFLKWNYNNQNGFENAHQETGGERSEGFSTTGRESFAEGRSTEESSTYENSFLFDLAI